MKEAQYHTDFSVEWLWMNYITKMEK